MSKKVIIESTVREGILDSLLPFLRTNLPKVRGFMGCSNVTVFIDKESRKLVLDEEWFSVEAHQEYINTISSNGVMGELVSFLEAPPEIKYLDRLDM
jgi:quinol monooxygenase YgiN